MELRAWLLLLTNRSMSCEAIGRDIKDYCQVGVDMFMKVSGFNEAAAISGHQTDYFAISSNNVRSEWRIKTDGIWKQWENLWGDKQFLLCLTIGSIMEEILKSHAAWIQWIEMRMSRYNTSLSPSSPSLSSLSYPGVGIMMSPRSLSHLSQTIPSTDWGNLELSWIWNISNFKLVSRLKEHPHTPTSLKHVWSLFINWSVYIKWIMEQSI